MADHLQPQRPALVAAFYNDLAIAHSYSGNQPAAIDAFSNSYRTQSEIYGISHKRTITSGSNLVHVMRSAGQIPQALELGSEVLTASLNEYGPVDRSVILSRFALALALSDADSHDQADEQMAASIVALRQLDDMRSQLPHQLSWHAEILIRRGDFSEAVGLLQETEAIFKQEFPDEARRYRLAAQRRLVQAHSALGECEAASGYMNNIAEEVAAGSADEALATEVYLLNCRQGVESASNGYADLVASTMVSGRDRNEMDAGLRAALNWADRRFGIAG